MNRYNKLANCLLASSGSGIKFLDYSNAIVVASSGASATYSAPKDGIMFISVVINKTGQDSNNDVGDVIKINGFEICKGGTGGTYYSSGGYNLEFVLSSNDTFNFKRVGGHEIKLLTFVPFK